MPISEPKKYSSTHIEMCGVFRSRLRDASRFIPDDALAEDGRESEHHLTILYGLTSPTPDDVESFAKASCPVSLMTNGVSVFETEEHDVVKIDVISPSAELLHSVLKKYVPNEDKWPAYRPHITLAYVKKGLGRVYCAPGLMPTFIGDVFSSKTLIFSSLNGEKTRLKLEGR